MTREEAINLLADMDSDKYTAKEAIALTMAIKALEQEPCEDVCKWFEQYVDIATDIVELRFSDGTVKRAKRGLYLLDIEESIRKMLIDQIANEKKQEPCDDCISRQAVIDGINKYFHDEYYQRTSIQDCRDCLIEDVIKCMPPATPQPKTGYWIEDHCSVCGKGIEDLIDSHEWYRNEQPNFCPFCGVKLVASQESEDK